jgi:hypothetical protein
MCNVGVLLFLIIFSNLTGGNSVDKAPPSAVKDFVEEHGGHTVITKVRSPVFMYRVAFIV